MTDNDEPRNMAFARLPANGLARPQELSRDEVRAMALRELARADQPGWYAPLAAPGTKKGMRDDR